MKKIKILATTDLHGYITPFNYSDRKMGPVGLSKLGPIIKRERDENTILVDAGDNLQGSPLMYYHMNHYADLPTPIAIAMNEVHYDYYTIGNHDLNFGQKQLRKHLSEMKAVCLTGNFILDHHRLSPKYRIHEFENGTRIALIGVLTDYIHHWEKPENLAGIEVEDVFNFVKEAVKEVKENEKADAIVVVYHGGLEKDWNTGEETEDLTGENVGYKICDEIDGIDVLITGHQHRSFVCRIKNTVVTQTMCNGKELACIEIDPENKRAEAKIIAGTDEYDHDLVEMFKEEEEETQNWLDTPLGCFKDGDCLVHDQFDGRLHKHRAITFLNDVQLWKTHAQLSSQALFNDVAGFAHDITMRDLVSTYMFPNTLVVKEVSGKVLKEFLEKCAEYFDYKDGKVSANKRFCEPKPMHFNYDMVDGIDYTIHASYPIGERVTDITYQGKPVKEDDLFSMAMSNYRASGGGDFDMIRPCRVLMDIQEDVVDIIRDYILEKKEVEINHRENIKVVK